MKFNQIFLNLISIILLSCLLECDSHTSNESEQIIIISESFDDQGNWILNADPNGSEGSNDTAVAEIVNSKLLLEANQDYGCPYASASIVLQDPVDESKSLTNIIIKIKIEPETDFSGLALAYFRCKYNNIYLEIELSNQNIHSGMLVFTFNNGTHTLSIDDTIINESSYEFNNSQSDFIKEIYFYVEACGADAYHFSHLEVDSIDISRFDD